MTMDCSVFSATGRGDSAETAENEIMAMLGNFSLGIKRGYHMNVLTKFEVPTEQGYKL
jgi:hypothetical protein